MISENLAKLSIPELCDLLVTSTRELHDLMTHKGQGFPIQNKQAEVEAIQGAIRDKNTRNHSITSLRNNNL